jgi:ABC-type uncharacterized transport system auxiliary subunit
MLRSIFIYLMALLTLTGCQAESTKSMNVIVTNSKTEVFYPSSHSDYKITIYAPNQPAPKGGWSIIYLLDGDSYFLTAHSILTNYFLFPMLNQLNCPINSDTKQV